MKLVEEDGLNYLSIVRAELNDTMKFTEFLLIMKEFRLERISIEVLTVRIKELFRGNSNLIIGVNKFLPKGHKIETDLSPKKDVQIKDMFQFIEKIKSLPNGVEVYKVFLEILNQNRKGEKSVSEVYQEVVMVFEEHHELLEDFRHFLPCSIKMPPLQQVASKGNSYGDTSFLVRKRERNATCQEDHEITVVEQLHERMLVDKHPSLASSDDNSDALRKSLQMEELSATQKSNKREKLDSVVLVPCESNAAHEHSFFSNREEDECEHSNHQTYHPSYCLVRKNHERPPLKKPKYEETVLNDDLMIKRSNKYYSSKQRRKSQYEEVLFQCEDDRFEMDMLIERTKSIVKCMEELLAKIQGRTFQSDDEINIEDHLNVLHFRYIEQLYGDQGQDMLDLLKRTPTLALPVILRRIKQKQEEILGLHSELRLIWDGVYANNNRNSANNGSNSEQS